MQLVLKSFILAAALLISACSHTTPPIDGTGVSPADLIIPRPEPVDLQQPDIMVVNRQNIDDFIALVQSGQVYVTLPLEEFNRMVENGQRVAVFIGNQNLVINQYEDRIRNPAE